MTLGDRRTKRLGSTPFVRGKLPGTCLVRLSPLSDLPEPNASLISADGLHDAPEVLSCADDYASVTWLGSTYSLGPDARVSFKRLLEASREGHEVSGATLLEAVEGYHRSVSELFRTSGLWGRVVIQGKRRGNYCISPEAL